MLVITRSSREEDRIIRCSVSTDKRKTSGTENCVQVMLTLGPECAICWPLVLPSFPLASDRLSFAPTTALGWSCPIAVNENRLGNSRCIKLKSYVFENIVFTPDLGLIVSGSDIHGTHNHPYLSS